MAARVNKIRHSDETRQKIKADRIIERLTCFFLGEADRTGLVPNLTQPQVNVGLGLLKKIVPDLQAVQHSGEITTSYVARVPVTATTAEQWEQKHQVPTVQ
jgi:hypothetical protein